MSPGSAKEITFTGTLVELPLEILTALKRCKRPFWIPESTASSWKRYRFIQRLQGTTPVARSLAIDGNGHTISGAYPGLWFKGMDSGLFPSRILPLTA